ncbi:hypothetical protein D9M71_528150 [compost metagenome]
MFAANPECRGDAAGMQGLGGDRHADRQVPSAARIDEGTAALVAAPVEEDFLHAHAAQELCADVPVIGHQHVLGAHQAADCDADGFLAEGRWIGADATGALHGHCLLVEQAGQHHLPIQAGQQVGVVSPGGQFADQAAVGVEVAGEWQVELAVRHDIPPPRVG